MRGEANKKERKEQQDIQKEDHENHSIPRTKMKTFSKGRAIERSKACWQVKSDRTRIWFPFLTAWRSYLLRSFSFWGDGNYRLYHVPAVPPQAQRTHSWLTCRYPSCNNLRTRSDNAHNVQSFCFCALKIWDLQMWFEYTFFFFFYLLSPRKGKVRFRCPFPETTSPDSAIHRRPGTVASGNAHLTYMRKMEWNHSTCQDPPLQEPKDNLLAGEENNL